MTVSVRTCLAILLGCLAASATLAAELPKMQFNEVKEIAPGVFFRYSAISPTDDKIFGGSNNVWVVFEDYVVVIDANFPKEAGDVIAAVKKTTEKPIRYVFDTHHHGDHAYGNAVFAKEGASIIAQANCARLMRETGAEEFKKAGEGPTGRKDVREGAFKVPNVVFDERLVLDDGKQRVEFLFLGHGHTPGDGVAYLPKHKVLCTGDACVNGAYNYTGHSDTASWIRLLERAKELDVDVICPGHGALVGKDLLDRQKRYFVELRQQVQKGVNAGKSLEEITASIDMPWYKEWTGVEAKSRKENVEHVYGEMTGRVVAWDLLEEFGLEEGASPTKDSPGWTKPKRIVVPNLMPARLKELKVVAPDVEFVPVKTAEEAAKAATNADAVIGYATADLVKTNKNLRWVQLPGDGVQKDVMPLLAKSAAVVTDTQGLDALQLADQAVAVLLRLVEPKSSPLDLHGKTLVVFGPDSMAAAVSKRGKAFGLRVASTDKPAKLKEWFAGADAVILTGPATEQTRGLIGVGELKGMKKTAYVVNAGAGALVDVDALATALSEKRLEGVGLVVAEAELPAKNHPLREQANVIIAPRASRSPEALERDWRLLRENVRRFVAGERLLSVAGKEGNP
jgi:cyclase